MEGIENEIVEDDKKRLVEWTERFTSLSIQKPMDQEQSKFFMSLMMDELKKDGDGPPEGMDQLFSYKLVKGRADALGMESTWQGIAFLADLTKSPGSAVMFVTAMRVKDAPLTMSGIANTYQMGFPDEGSLQELWDAQKVGGKNLLDRTNTILA